MVARDREALVRELLAIDPDGVMLWLYWIVSPQGEATPVALCDSYGTPAYTLTSAFTDLIEPHFADVAKSAAVSARYSIL